MLKNYFLTALRNFKRNKVFSTINIIGLAIGISASLVIYLIVSYDFSFDKSVKSRDAIYRIVSTMHFPDEDFKNPGVPMPLAAAVQKEVTGIAVTASFHTGFGDVTVRIADNKGKPAVYKKQKDIIYADGNYFALFAYQWLAGSAATALNEPFKVVLTESRARAYFPGEEPAQVVGQVITYYDSINATVTGVVADRVENTELIFKEFISFSTIENSGLKEEVSFDQWGNINSSSQLYIRLNPGVSPAAVNKQIAAVHKTHAKDAYLEITYNLQPFSDIHFNPDFNGYTDRQAHLPTLYGLMIFAAILLILGCINFINLTTAQSAQRAKEIGIRKTMGGSKQQLVVQFLSETFVLTLIATAMSVVVVPLLLKVFADFIPPELHFSMIWDNYGVAFILGMIIIVTLCSGSYPALVLSSGRPIHVLKHQSFSGAAKPGKAWLRKSLTLVQFIIAQVFIIGAMGVGNQIRYTLNKELGFNKDGIIVLHTPYYDEDAGKRQVLLQKALGINGVAQACLAGSAPASNNLSMKTLKYNNGTKDIETTVEIKYADEAFFKLYNIRLLAGRYPKKSDTTTEYVINEHYARFLGFSNPADAVGSILDPESGGKRIVGVIKDYFSHSLHTPIKPLAFTSVSPGQRSLHILLQPTTGNNSWAATISALEQAWKTVYPDETFDYSFVDESIASFYQSEQDISKLLQWATGLAILISCLGLLGLVMYTTNIRTKEIGVRKVLGASVSQIVTMVSKDFIYLVLVAFVIAVPLAWWGIHQWLENFAYRSEPGVLLFAGAGATMLLVALATLSVQTIKAASANPVDSLRNE